MVVATETVTRRYEDVAVGVEISVDIPAFEASDVYVYYGNSALVAAQGTDYTVALAGDFNTFTVTPTASLIAKIDALISADPGEVNAITVRRVLDYLTDATPAGVRYTPFTSKEFDRNAMRDQQLADSLTRTLRVKTTAGVMAEIDPSEGTRILGFSDGQPFLFTLDPGAPAEDGAIAYVTPQAMLASAETSRGEGALWRAGRFLYQEAATDASDHDLTVASGVKLYVLKAGDGAYHTDAWAVAAGVDESTKFNAALAKAANGTLVINYNVAAYIGDRLIPEANTTIILEPAVRYLAKDGGTRCIQIQKANVHVWGYGAELDGDGTQNSHRVYFNAGGTNIAENCSIRGVKAIGAGNSGDDCFYVGGSPQTGILPKNISIIDCIGDGDAKARNVLSIVAVDGCLVDGCDFYNALSAPGLAIDVEANRFMDDGTSAVKSVTIRKTKCHDCPNNAGIGVIFGSEVTIEDCDVWGNVKGIIAGAGGAQFNTGVYRKGDRLGVGAFDTVDGWITVTTGTDGVDKLTDDLGIYVGMLAAKNTALGAAWPTEYSLPRYVIAEIDSTQAKFKLGLAPGVGVVIPTGSGTGTLDLDPEVSDLDWIIYGRAGNNDNITVRNCRIWGNTANVNNNEVDMGTSRDILFEGNKVQSDGYGCTFPYSTDVRVIGNRIRQNPGKTTGRGLSLSNGFGHIVRDNYVEGFAAEGVTSNGGNGSLFSGGEIVNCGHNAQEALQITNHKDGKFIDIVIRNDAAHQCSKGANFGTGCNRNIARGIVAEGVAGSNANSLSGNRDAVRFIECVQYDGKIWGEAETTYDPPSLADGAVTGTTIIVPGALSGDYAIASFPDSELALTAIAYNGGVRVKVRNDSGATRDAASGTLRVKVIPR